MFSPQKLSLSLFEIASCEFHEVLFLVIMRLDRKSLQCSFFSVHPNKKATKEPLPFRKITPSWLCFSLKVIALPLWNQKRWAKRKTGTMIGFCRY